MRWIHYYLGKIAGVRYREWYHDTHKNQWLWGVIQFMIDFNHLNPELREDDVELIAFEDIIESVKP